MAPFAKTSTSRKPTIQMQSASFSSATFSASSPPTLFCKYLSPTTGYRTKRSLKIFSAVNWCRRASGSRASSSAGAPSRAPWPRAPTAPVCWWRARVWAWPRRASFPASSTTSRAGSRPRSSPPTLRASSPRRRSPALWVGARREERERGHDSQVLSHDTRRVINILFSIKFSPLFF